MSIPEDEDLLEQERYADWRPVRAGAPIHRPGRDRSDGLQWGALLAAAAAGFLIAIFGPCRSTDRDREQELSSLKAELQSAQDRAAQLEAELSAAREGVAPPETPEPSEPVAQAASAPEPQTAAAPAPPAPVREERRELTPEEVLRGKAPAAEPEVAREAEPPAATIPPPPSTPPPEASAEPDRVALVDSQGAVSVFEVPDPAAPSVRSVSRPDQPGVAVLQVLAPEQAGWTTQAQPTIYWHSSEGRQLPGEFTLTREGSDEPMVRGRFPAPDPGIQRIELSQFGISLEEGASYQWKVAFADGAASATGGIRRVAAPEKPRAATVTERLDALERAGLWYDALDLVIRSIENNSGAKDLVARRRAMLGRVGIHVPG